MRFGRGRVAELCARLGGKAALELSTTIELAGPAGAIVLDNDQVAQLGGGKRAPVRVSVGERSARRRLAVMGGRNLIGMSKVARTALGLHVGAEVRVRIDLDTEQREVEVPAALAEALQWDPEAKVAFDALAYTHRKEFAQWVVEAKRHETRERRVIKTMEMLRA